LSEFNGIMLTGSRSETHDVSCLLAFPDSAAPR